MIISLGLALVVTAMAAPAPEVLATESVPKPVVITNPTWKTAPAPTEADYPHLAAHLGIAGRVVVECKISTEGVPDCEAVSIAPEGLGFETTAITIADPSRWDGPEPSRANLLAGMVAAQAWGHNIASSNQIDWGLNQLERERAHMTERWISEMYLGGTNVKLLGRAFAMVLAKRGQNAMPVEQPADWADWNADFEKALGSIFTSEANYAPLRARFCGRYDCGPEAGTP
ncbi:hypothetical protein [Brevundimonas sp.]|uniref:hypothetical protein n=1 Tax=Brevundimonas sp. TaxID=1871086 RepID=UPI002FC925B2